MKTIVLAYLTALAIVSLVAPLSRSQSQGAITINDPAEYNAYVSLGMQTSLQGKASIGEQFLTQYPKSVVRSLVLDILITTYQQLGDSGKALSAANRLLKIDPNNPKALSVSNPHGQAVSAPDANKPPIEQNQGTIQIRDPAELTAFQNFTNQTDLNLKASAGETFLTRYPTNIMVLDALIDTYQQLESPDKALSVANRLLRLDPNNRKAQLVAAPPPRPADGGQPGYEETMQFIADKINDEGVLNYILDEPNPHGPPVHAEMISRASNVRFFPTTCLIQYHWEMVQFGQHSDSYIFLNLRDVQDLEVLSAEDFSDKFTVAAGAPISNPKVTPEFYVVWVRTKSYLACQRAAKQGTFCTTDNPNLGLPYPFDFRDQDMANRVARAMVHAVDLCGGGSKQEPF